ncbi:hypothetical protein V5799_024869 [Amblyomma americanum]|uniref:Uncharacterized protein n=1 Tax=Amblyomma americanum TaxID=6943 RepID=A0AAQ4EAS1_AMBAM
MEAIAVWRPSLACASQSSGVVAVGVTDGTGPSLRPEDCGLQALPQALGPAAPAGPSPPPAPPHRLHVDALQVVHV